MRIDIIALFVCLDDFCKLCVRTLQQRLLGKLKQNQRLGYLTLSEMFLIQSLYHFSQYKDFKRFYLYGICREYSSYFNKLPSYQ